MDRGYTFPARNATEHNNTFAQARIPGWDVQPEGDHSMHNRAVVIASAMMALLPGTVVAELSNLIPSLYGGDGITLAPPSGPFPSHEAHFTVESLASINQLNENISTQVAAFPFPSTTGGFAFEFRPELGTFVQVTESLGPVFAERARTVGKNKLNVNASLTFFKYDSFEGTDLSNLQAAALHDADVLPPPDVRTSFELDEILLHVDLDIRVQILSLAANYGVTDRFDVGILVPFVRVDMDVRSHAQIVVSPDNPFPSAHQFGAESPDDAVSDSATGLGDIVLRAKYHWLKSDTNNVAVALLVKTETGDEKDFLGTGDTTVRPYLIYSRKFGNLTPHINLGYKFNLDTSDKNTVEYAVGFDYATRKVTVAADIIGSKKVDNSGIGDRIVNGALGLKWSPAKNVVLGGNVMTSLNDDGLRSDLITTISAEYTF